MNAHRYRTASQVQSEDTPPAPSASRFHRVLNCMHCLECGAGHPLTETTKGQRTHDSDCSIAPGAPLAVAS